VNSEHYRSHFSVLRSPFVFRFGSMLIHVRGSCA
jgi:hypothetical protein